MRLYRETPAAAAAKGRGGKGRGAKAKPPDAGAWELLADSLDALREAGEKLRRNKQRPEQRLASQVHCMPGRLGGCHLLVRAPGCITAGHTQSIGPAAISLFMRVWGLLHKHCSKTLCLQQTCFCRLQHLRVGASPSALMWWV